MQATRRRYSRASKSIIDRSLLASETDIIAFIQVTGDGVLSNGRRTSCGWRFPAATGSRTTLTAGCASSTPNSEVKKKVGSRSTVNVGISFAASNSHRSPHEFPLSLHSGSDDTWHR